MLDNPYTGQRVRIAPEYRDEWPVHNLGDRVGEIVGISNVVMVRFGIEIVHLSVRVLEPA